MRQWVPKSRVDDLGFNSFYGAMVDCGIGALKTIPTFFTFYDLSLILNINLLNNSTAVVNVLSVENKCIIYTFIYSELIM